MEVSGDIENFEAGHPTDDDADEKVTKVENDCDKGPSSIEDVIASMFGHYEERFDRLSPFPSTTDSFNIEELASLAEDTEAYRDRTLVTIALHRPGHHTLTYETIDLGHMTWFEILAMSPKELGKLNGSSERSWKFIHSPSTLTTLSMALNLKVWTCIWRN